MTEVAFHFNLPDRLPYLCRLLRKACGQGAKVGVVGDIQVLAELDQALWSFSPVEFVPHCSTSAASTLLALTPVVLGEDAGDVPHDDVLVNLGVEVPAGFERFSRVIELVGAAPQDRMQSRLRWKYYQDRGYAIVRHDMARKEIH